MRRIMICSIYEHCDMELEHELSQLEQIQNLTDEVSQLKKELSTYASAHIVVSITGVKYATKYIVNREEKTNLQTPFERINGDYIKTSIIVNDFPVYVKFTGSHSSYQVIESGDTCSAIERTCIWMSPKKINWMIGPSKNVGQDALFGIVRIPKDSQKNPLLLEDMIKKQKSPTICVIIYKLVDGKLVKLDKLEPQQQAKISIQNWGTALGDITDEASKHVRRKLLLEKDAFCPICLQFHKFADFQIALCGHGMCKACYQYYMKKGSSTICPSRCQVPINRYFTPMNFPDDWDLFVEFQGIDESAASVGQTGQDTRVRTVGPEDTRLAGYTQCCSSASCMPARLSACASATPALRSGIVSPTRASGEFCCKRLAADATRKNTERLLAARYAMPPGDTRPGRAAHAAHANPYAVDVPTEVWGIFRSKEMKSEELENELETIKAEYEFCKSTIQFCRKWLKDHEASGVSEVVEDIKISEITWQPIYLKKIERLQWLIDHPKENFVSARTNKKQHHHQIATDSKLKSLNAELKSIEEDVNDQLQDVKQKYLNIEAQTINNESRSKQGTHSLFANRYGNKDPNVPVIQPNMFTNPKLWRDWLRPYGNKDPNVPVKPSVVFAKPT